MFLRKVRFFLPAFFGRGKTTKVNSAGGQDVVVAVVQQPWVVKRCAMFQVEGTESQWVERNEGASAQ